MKKFLYKILIIFIFVIQLCNLSLCDDIEEETIDVSAEIQASANNATSKIKLPEINSRAYVVIDRNSNTIICGKKENEKRKMASTTKIMTAIVIIENYNLDETIEVSKKAAGTGGSRLGLKSGDKITIRDLLYGLMLKSGNDTAVALAEYAGGNIEGFAELMNKKAQELGLNNTNFVTPHGLDSDEHYTTAYELALLSNYALKNKIFSQIVGTKTYTVYINNYPKTISNTNELLGILNGVYGIKTGFTNGANRCLVTACKRNNMDIICVVLGADTKKFRTSDSIKLINYTFENFEPIDIKKIVNDKFETWKNNELSSIIINKGFYNNLEVYLENLENDIIPIRKDLIDNINVTIDYESYLDSPLPQDSTIGNVSVFSDNKNIGNCKIYNKYTINKKSFLHYSLNILKNYPNIIETCIF